MRSLASTIPRQRRDVDGIGEATAAGKDVGIVRGNVDNPSGIEATLPVGLGSNLEIIVVWRIDQVANPITLSCRDPA